MGFNICKPSFQSLNPSATTDRAVNVGRPLDKGWGGHKELVVSFPLKQRLMLDADGFQDWCLTLVFLRIKNYICDRLSLMHTGEALNHIMYQLNSQSVKREVQAGLGLKHLNRPKKLSIFFTLA